MTFAIDRVTALRWSGDSSRLAVAAGGGELWEVQVGPGMPGTVLRLPVDGLRWVGFPDYFPNGDPVLVTQDGTGAFSLVRLRGLAGRQTILTSRAPLTGPRVSPDGRKVALLVGEPGETTLWVVDPETGQALAAAPAPAENPVWAPDSQTLAFERPQGSARTVMFIDLGSGRLAAAGPGAFPYWAGDELLWVGPAGQLMVSSGGSPARIVLETAVGEVQFAAWGGAGLVVLYHRGGLTLADVRTRLVVPLRRTDFPVPVGSVGEVQGLGAGFGIPSTGYVSDVFRAGHPGLDIAKPFNLPENQAPIVAAYPGRVVWAGDAWSGPYGGYGNLVIIDHGLVGGVHVATYYAHWRTRYVNVGDFVPTGWRLADQSDYGWTTGVHLHFEVREGGTPTAWRPYFDGTPADPTGPRYLNRPLQVGDYVIAATPTPRFRALMPVVRR